MRIKWFSVIRVVGLLFVLLYHFFIKYFSGGFVGVDLFFTLSGYLTTALLIDEFTQDKTIDLVGFFRRRLYRILPPLLLMILAVTPLALLVRNDFIANIGNQIAAALGFMTNIFEILTGGNYENQFTPHLFVHTWTLAIEVQFYLLWGLAVWGMTRMAKSIGQLRGLIFLSSSAIFLISFLSMFISSFFVDSYSTIYFSTWTHIFPFFLGTILATIAGIKNTTKGFQRTIQQWSKKKALQVFLAGFTLELLLLFLLKFNSIWTYLFGFLLSSIATSVMIFAARVLHEKTEEVNEPLAVQYLADISYGFYLFHWPLYLIFSQIFGSIGGVILTVIFSLLLSTASFYILEPYLAGKTGRLFTLEIDLKPYTKWISIAGGLLALGTLLITLTAPKLGNFDTEMLVNSLKQADTRMAQTKANAEKGKASGYDIEEGVTIIGDSVTLRATPQLNEQLPGAFIDAQESRNTQQAYEILKTNIDSGTLLKDVVIATGTNVIYNYDEELDKIVDILPNGYRLILVTPYDGNAATYEDPLSEKHAQYVRNLAKKHNFITVADWNAVSKANPQIWVGSDNVHFGSDAETTAEGGTLFTQTIKTALEEAAQKPVKGQE